MTLSVCILTNNNQQKLKKCLESVKKIADEIIVVIDDTTTDNSEQISRQFTERVFIRPHQNNFHILKQFAIEQASQKWILWMDDDEELEPDLGQEIRNIVQHPLEDTDEDNLTNTVFQIPRKNIIFNKWIEHTGWYPDYQIRLWRNGTVYWPCQSVHEHPNINNQQLQSLQNHLIHHNYQTLSQWLQKLDSYSTNDAKHYIKEFSKPYYKNFLTRPLDQFVERYIKDQGYKDGLHGLVLSILQSFYMVIVSAKAWEMKKFEQETIHTPLQSIEQQAKYLKKIWKWWKYEDQITTQKSAVKKLALRIKRKIS